MSETNQQIAKLLTMLAVRKAQILANPKPYLDKAHAELYRARKCFDDLERALSPDTVYDFALKMNMRPINIQGEALIRCNAALKVLREYHTRSESKP